LKNGAILAILTVDFTEPLFKNGVAMTLFHSSKSLISVAAVLLTALFLVFSASAPEAQVPPHAPGTVCLAPNAWCWIDPPLPLGASCTCGGEDGQVI
jgi:hypothetical protein